MGNSRVTSAYGLACKGETTDRESACDAGNALEDFGAPMDIAGLPADLDPSGSVAVATFESDTCSGTCSDAGLKITLDGGQSWNHVADRDTTETTYGGTEACTYNTFFAVRSEIAIDPLASTFTSSTNFDLHLYLSGESNSDTDSDGKYDCGLVEVIFDDSDLTSGEYLADWNDIVIPSTCRIDGGNLSGVRVVPWVWTPSSAARLMAWGAWDDRSGTAYGGACTFTRTGTDLVGIIDPSASTNRFDIDDVLPHPWMDRVLFVQPSVKAVTRSECGTTCAKPTPLLIESLRNLGSPNFGWHFSEITTDGLQGLRGNGLAFGGDSTVERLYYVGSGSGVHQSTDIADTTW